MVAFNPKKFKKLMDKTSDIGIGFNDPIYWISTGNYALNKAVSNDFNKGVPMGKVNMFAGESGSGKSYLVSGNIVRNAQKQGFFTVLIDTENALDEQWLINLGVDISPDKLMRLEASTVDKVASIINGFMTNYIEDHGNEPRENRPKVLFVIDSLGMLMTANDIKQFSAGELKGDMGLKAKALTALIRNCVIMFGKYDIGMVVTNHTFASQDIYNPDDRIASANGFIFASSIVLAMRKYKLKVDEDGVKTAKVHGIRSQIKIMKTRYNKPFETVEVLIPWDTGMDEYSGLIEMFEAKGLLVTEGRKLKYTALDGTEYKEFRKNITHDLLDLIMSEYDAQIEKIYPSLSEPAQIESEETE